MLQELLIFERRQPSNTTWVARSRGRWHRGRRAYAI